MSDISGQDISAHKGKILTVIRAIRDWLDTCQDEKYSLLGGDHIYAQYQRFCRNLPSALNKLSLKDDRLTYADICRAIEAWLKDNT